MATTATSLESVTAELRAVRDEIGKVIVGHENVVEGALIALVAGGHVLLEGVPGLGKTTLLRTLGETMHLKYSRIQFTPDLMPGDILGSMLMQSDESGLKSLRFDPGPIFAHLVLADEINRATPRTQSALLEAMQEKTVTSGTQTYRLEDPFLVMATQNPLEMEGTYPLPEAQLDRFFFKVQVPFPTLDDLVEVMARTTGNQRPEVQAVLTPQELTRLRHIVREVAVAPEVMRYAMRLVLATQTESRHALPLARTHLRYGASPRGAQTLILGARAYALFHGRTHAAIGDVRAVALPALRHRMGPSFEADAEGLGADALVGRLLDEVPEVEGRVARELGATA